MLFLSVSSLYLPEAASRHFEADKYYPALQMKPRLQMGVRSPAEPGDAEQSQSLLEEEMGKRGCGQPSPRARALKQCLRNVFSDLKCTCVIQSV